MNILVAFNKKYLVYFIALLKSIQANNNGKINIYIFTKDVTIEDILAYQNEYKSDCNFNIIIIDDTILKDAPISTRYPFEIYYRIFASKFLPKEIDKILYLDCDIIVKGNLAELYNSDFKNNLYIATTNVGKFLKFVNQIKNSAKKETEYINTGVLLMNLKLLREIQNFDEVFKYISTHKKVFTLPDQDIISTLYGDRILIFDHYIYNLSDRIITLNNIKNKEKIDLNWVENNAVIIHYLGKNKPWNENYKGILNIYYNKYKVNK